MNKLWKDILSKISDRSLKYIDKNEFPKEFGLKMMQFKEQLQLMQDESLLEFKSFTATRWEVRIKSNGYKFLNGTIE